MVLRRSWGADLPPKYFSSTAILEHLTSSCAPHALEQVIRRQLAEGVSVRRVGLVTSLPDPAHQHSEVLTPEGQKVGEITSSAFSPSLQRNIAMG